MKAIGSAAWVFPAYNLGLVHLTRGDHERARRVLESAMEAFIAQGNTSALAHAHLGLAACAATDELWLRWDNHLGEARRLLQVTGAADEDTARLAAFAASRARDAHQPGRARDAYELAATLWRTLRRDTEVERMDRILAALP